MSHAAPKPVRCAVYTRKSTDENLELDFNSLDAQRESAEAYVASQKGAGWVCLPNRYDDAGFSGATVDRPAFPSHSGRLGSTAMAFLPIGLFWVFETRLRHWQLTPFCTGLPSAKSVGWQLWAARPGQTTRYTTWFVAPSLTPPCGSNA